MKALLIFFIAILNFSFINSFHKFFPRKLQEIPTYSKRGPFNLDNILILVDFGNYSNYSKTFNIYFKNSNMSISYDGYMNTIISYEDGKNPTNIKCNCANETFDELIFSCPIGNLDDTLKVKILNDNYTFYKKSGLEIPTQVIISSLAETSKNDILSSNTTLYYYTFYLDDISISGNNVEIKGKSNIPKEFTNKTFTLKLNTELYECKVTNTTINFSLTKNVKDKLIGKMLTNSDEQKILIFSNKTIVDAIIYYKLNGFLGFDNYQSPDSEEYAKNRANFIGTSNILKKYLRFNTNITTYLGILDRKTNISVTAYGERDDNISNDTRGYITYNIVYENTKNQTIIDMNKIGDFQISDDNETFKTIQVNYLTGLNPNLMESRKIKYEPFSSINYTTDNKTLLSLNITTVNEIQLTADENPANLSYIQYEDDCYREETSRCSIKKINNTCYELNCEPRNDINASYSSLQIKIDNQINKKRQLRFLDNSENITLLYPGEDLNENIVFEYEPEIGNFTRDDKGLSGGAIAGIVIGSVAAVVAIGIAIYFLTRKTPTKMPINNANFHDSSININK